ncbi:biliverdin-producing heme oxygenase [Paracoccus sp. KR1-242]|uniref:biliverdin-producing heme oxygenase n=1 Tax=Paracoccus sp. KR1-242 TaxID=3410028 RepID=UPI003C02760C
MTTNSLRRELYHGTRDLHDALDESIGPLSRREDYARYLVGTLQFRGALEGPLATGAFPALQLLADLRRDLADLGIKARSEMPPIAVETHEARVAALYVAEGSAVGARLISRRAAHLGFDQTFGARHLSRQASESDRWPRFLQWLEVQDVAHERVVTEGRRVFLVALQAFGVDA